MQHTHCVLVCSLLLIACDSPTPEPVPTPVPPTGGTGNVQPVDAFLAAFAPYCGRAYAGRIVANEPPTDDDPFVGQTLIMHVAECAEGEIRIPFHVGEDRSRTWVLTRKSSGLQLKHDHRHEDGSPDAVTMYGGTSASAGSGERQAFPVDDESIEMFRREGLDASVTNTWAMEFEPGNRFVYELSRPGGRLFRVEFDLATPVEPPPAPWGHHATGVD